MDQPVKDILNLTFSYFFMKQLGITMSQVVYITIIETILIELKVLCHRFTI